MIKKVVLTGGPGSGKTTVIESIKKNFSNRYKVIVVDETASYLINMGIRPFGEGSVSMIDFQELVLKMQLAKEEVISRAIEFLPDEDILLVFDRGLLDNCAYIGKDEFQEILGRLPKKHTINEFLERYDLILNLVSRRDLYTTDNNPARSEDVDEALRLGDATLNAWIGHKNIKIIFPKDDINDKIHEVLNAVNEVLNEKEVKRQEKFVVSLEGSDLDKVLGLARRCDIVQTYLEGDENVERRLRKTTMNGVSRYNYTVYSILEDGTKVKVSDEAISRKLYEKLLEFQDNNLNSISKTRYYFPWKGEYFSLDIMDGYGILEVNVVRDDILLPPFLNVLENVSNNPDFQNKNIAKKNSRQFVKE